MAKTIPEFKLWPLQQVLVSNIRSSVVALTAAVIAVLLGRVPQSCGTQCRAGQQSSARDCPAQRAWSFARRDCTAAAVGEFSARPRRVSAWTWCCELYASGAACQLADSYTACERRSCCCHFGVTLPLVFGVTLLCGLLPSWLVFRRNTATNLQAGHSAGASVSDSRMSKTLLVSQTAMAVLLLSAAHFFLRCFSGCVPLLRECSHNTSRWRRSI